MNEQNEIVLYQPNENLQLQVRLENDTVWLTQAQMVQLFASTKQNISLHINNIFREGELEETSTVKEYLTVQKEGNRDIIIDGYVDALTFDILDVRTKGVKAEIYTSGVGAGMRRLMETHDKEADKEHIEVYKWKNESHDRWLIIDNTLYHCGHSLNAMGKHLSAISQLGISPEEILNQVR